MLELRRTRRRIRILLAAIPALVFLLLGAMLLAALTSQNEGRASVGHMRDVQLALRDVLSDVQTAESGQRGFLLTHDAQYLAPFRSSIGRLATDTAALRRLTADNPVQQRNLDSLAPLVSAKLAELNETMARRTASGITAALSTVRSNRGLQVMEAIRQVLANMNAEEERLLAARTAAEEHRKRVTVLLLLLGGAASIALAFLVNQVFLRNTSRLEAQLHESHALREELESANDKLHAAVVASQAAADRERFLVDASAALGRAPFDVESTMTAVVRTTVPFLADYCSIDILGDDGTIQRVAAAHRDPQRERVLKEMWRKYPFNADETAGSPAVLRTKEPVLVPEMSDLQLQGFARSDEHLAMLRALNPRSYLAVPLLVRGEGAGVFALVMSDSGRRMDDERLALATELARRAGLAIDRAWLYKDAQRARDEAAASAERFSFLARASDLLASSLDYEVTLASVAQLAVPSLADWCGVDVLDPDGQVRQLAVAHADPEKVEWARELGRRYPTDPNSPTGTPNVIRTGKTEVYNEIPEEMLRAGARDAEHLRLIRQLSITSALIVPMTVRGRTVGAISLVGAESKRRFEAADVALAEELALRGAVAIENARLFRDAEAAAVVAKSANQAKSNFLAAMSHELRTPINAIMGYTELMELGLSGPLTDDQRQQLARVHAASRHLLELVEDVLDLAKIEAGTLRIERGTGVAGDSVNAALALVRPQAVAKSVTISDGCDGLSTSVFRGDHHRARQILTNLLVNAVKFTDPGGRVTASCALAGPAELPTTVPANGQFLAFHVTDTGIGIKASDQDRIFAPFVQVGGGDRTPGASDRTSAGLGLAISRQLARLMDGEITVRSEPGRGSIFTLWLPAAGETEGVDPPDA